MKTSQPKVIARGLLAAGLLSMLSGVALIAPSMHVQGAQQARLATLPATYAHSLRPHQAAVKHRGTRTRFHKGGPTRTHSSTATIVVTPPVASHVHHAVRLHWSEATTARHIFGMGLPEPRRDNTFVFAHAPSPRAGPRPRAVPASVDLSTWDPPVANQGQVNACASWSTGYTALGWYANHDGLAGSPYAPMYVYAQLAGGQNAGTSFESNFAIEQHGIDTQADYHQGSDDYTDLPTSAEKANAANYHITGYTTIYIPGSGSAQAAIATALAAGRPVVVGLPVYSNFMNATAANAVVDLPPPGAAYYGNHGVVGVKYDATGLWVENQWGSGWGLNGYAELTWSFVNQYLLSAYTINGFQAPSNDDAVTLAATAPTGAPAAPTGAPAAPTGAPAAPDSATATATPAGSPVVSVSPSSGAPGSSLTISGSGFGSGLIALYSNGVLMVLVSSSNGSFAQAASISTGAAPGPRTILAQNQSNGRQASTIYTVTGSSPTATSVPKTPAPTSTSTPPPTATKPAPTQPAATSTPAGTATLSLNPSSGATGVLVALSGSGFRPNELVTITWDSAPLVYQMSTAQGTLSYQFFVSSSASAGAHTVTATGASGIKASATFTVSSGSVATATATATLPPPSATPTRPAASPTSTPTHAAATPTSTPTHPAATATSTPTRPAASPTATPAQPTATPTPPNGIPTSGTTSNGCQITPDSGAAEAQLIGLLNQDRASAGVAPLTLNSSLSTISRTHSCDMFQHQQLNHNGSDGSTPYTRMAAGGFGMPPYSQEGENIGDAYGMPPSQAIALLDAQMMAEPDSPGTHHWNIVNSGYTIVGVGVIVANGQTWLTEDFAG